MYGLSLSLGLARCCFVLSLVGPNLPLLGRLRPDAVGVSDCLWGERLSHPICLRLSRLLPSWAPPAGGWVSLKGSDHCLSF
eukprot:SAG22_NODE_27_length_29018_cov_465.809646_19_plen_81_part_00